MICALCTSNPATIAIGASSKAPALPIRANHLALSGGGPSSCHLCAAAPGAAQAAKFPAVDCPRYDSLDLHGAVPSFDGTPLDADLTLPAGKAPGGGAHPLIVLLHGFSGDKHDWQSSNDTADGKDKWHWNSHWFAKRGYYVLSYTARGFRTDHPGSSTSPRRPRAVRRACRAERSSSRAATRRSATRSGSPRNGFYALGTTDGIFEAGTRTAPTAAGRG